MEHDFLLYFFPNLLSSLSPLVTSSLWLPTCSHSLFNLASKYLNASSLPDLVQKFQAVPPDSTNTISTSRLSNPWWGEGGGGEDCFQDIKTKCRRNCGHFINDSFTKSSDFLFMKIHLVASHPWLGRPECCPWC